MIWDKKWLWRKSPRWPVSTGLIVRQPCPRYQRFEEMGSNSSCWRGCERDFLQGRKKAQMEMGGLVIIVILITLGMLFLAIFALREAPTKKVFTREGLAYSTLSSLMKMTVVEPGCAVKSLGKNILEDCAGYQDTSPDGYSQYRCRGKHSCDFLQEIIPELLGPTLDEWRKSYEFQAQLVRAEGEDPEILVGVKGKGDCAGKREKDASGIFPLNVEGVGLIESVLYLCD